MTLSKLSTRLLLGSAIALGLMACQPASDTANNDATSPATESGISLNVETYKLDNGLTVVLHQDRSDPIVAINLAAHVGSGRETEGNTGFAHLFEHLLFLDSENLGYGGLDEMNTRIGGEGTNGFTTHDMTQYFQAVPSDALEKVIWAEADKLCCFINTVSQAMVDREKQVVKNEKRQRVDNQPYGHMLYIVNKAIYPSDHPYNWQVIGSLADLEAASLEETHNFYKRWYTPNNVVLTLTGDFEMAEAKALIEKYFGEIPSGDPVENFQPRPGTLADNTSLYYEDKFATVPQLAIVWPTVDQYHPDRAALDVMFEYWTSGKDAPLNQVMIDEMGLTSNVTGFHYTKEVSGEGYIIVRAKDGEDLDTLIPGIEAGFARFEENGIPQGALNRIKTKAEVDFYGNFDSVLSKSIALAEYTLFSGDPNYYKTELDALKSVTTDDVMRVYETYFKGKNALYVSIVPQGQSELKLDTPYPAQPAQIVEEQVVAGAEKEVEFDPTIRDYTPTPSSFDRSVEPDFGPAYILPTADILEHTSESGVTVMGLQSDETPLVEFSIYIDAGYNRADVSKPAVPNLVGDMLMKGTQNKTTAELENALKDLGSTVNVNVGSEGVYISGTSLSRNLGPTLDIVEEIVLEPRWDEEEFKLLMERRNAELDQAQGNPNSIASRAISQISYPEDHAYHYGGYAPAGKLNAVTLDDVKAYHAAYYRPQNARILLVGDAGKDDVTSGADRLLSGWSGEEHSAPSLAPMAELTTSKVYFVDVPDAKQSILRIFKPSLDANHPDLGAMEGINLLLGGIYTSDLMTELRVNKGYTYGVRSRFDELRDRGTFGVSTSVRTNVTAESITIIRDILNAYGPSFDAEKLKTLKDALLRGQALKSESLGDKLGLLGQIAHYGYERDFRAQNAKRIENLSIEETQALVAEHMGADPMIYVVVGDAKTQMAKVEALGLGEIEMVEVKWD